MLEIVQCRQQCLYYPALFIFISILLIAFSCDNPSGDDKKSKLGRQERIKLKQYFNEGKRLYGIHCANCHQHDGSGLARLYPPLNNSDYLNAGVERIICHIWNGAEGEMVVNGITFNMPMPEKSDLSPLEIAEITTYIFNEWGNMKELVSIEQVSGTLEVCDSLP